MADVRLENVTKRFGRTIALRQVSFECKEGEFFTLLGPSGAGKTTTLELIAGLKKVDDGEIYIGGNVVNDWPPQDRGVAMAFENYALYSHMTVYENSAFPLRSPRRKQKVTATEERAKVAEITTLLGIFELIDRKPQQLSGGQKQRVSLARAMIRRPEVYLLDEPIAHLDAKLRAQARSNLKKIAHEYGITILYVTHNYREALALSDRILILRNGQIEQIGTPEEIYKVPASDFTANLVGDPPINLIDGELKSEGGNLFFMTKDKIKLRINEQNRARATQASWEDNGKQMIRLGIRAGAVTVKAQPTNGNAFQKPVYVVEHEGEDWLLKFELGDGRLLIANVGKVKSPFQPAENVWIEFDQDKTYFFQKTIDLE